MSLLARTIATIAICTIALSATGDECASDIPAALQAVLTARYDAFRVPLAADSESLCVSDRRRAGRGVCMLVTRGDFDGDGNQDVALVMPSVRKGGGWQLIIALDRVPTWHLDVVASSRIGDARHLMLEQLSGGVYRETEAVLAPGATPRTIRSDHAAVMLGSCDSWATGYFRVDGRWIPLALSD